MEKYIPIKKESNNAENAMTSKQRKEEARDKKIGLWLEENKDNSNIDNLLSSLCNLGLSTLDVFEFIEHNKVRYGIELKPIMCTSHDYPYPVRSCLINKDIVLSKTHEDDEWGEDWIEKTWFSYKEDYLAMLNEALNNAKSELQYAEDTIKEFESITASEEK